MMKIAIIGAGVAGLMAAYMVKKAGFSVTVYEKEPGFPPQNASSIAGGMLAPYAEIETLNDDELSTGLNSLAMWRDISSDLSDNIGLALKGSLLLSHGRDKPVLDRFKTHLHRHTGSWTPWTEEIVEREEPDLADRFTGALFLEQEGHLDPHRCMGALYSFLKGRGVPFIQKNISTTDDKALRRDFDWIVDCRGMAAAQDDADLRPVKGELLYIQCPDFSLSRPVRLMHPRYPLYIVPREDHVFMVGATMIETDDLDKSVTVPSALELLSAVYSLSPKMTGARVLSTHAGLRPAYPDNKPRITLERDDKAVRLNGLFRHGYLLSPVLAKAIAHYIKTEEKSSEFRLFEADKHDRNHSQRNKNAA